MTLPTVRDCVRLDGAKRELLREFDHLLRDALATTQRIARSLELGEEEVGPACVTVMMTVAAGAALAASDSPADVTEAHFSAIARDALAWARNKASAGDRKH